MEEYIQNNSPTVMFRGTPCSTNHFHKDSKFNLRFDFLIKHY